MVKISKEECEFLRNNGVRMGENGISHTVGSGKKRTYYLCESTRNIDLLNKIRNTN